MAARTSEDDSDEECSGETIESLIAVADSLLERLRVFELAKGKECGIHKFRRKVVSEREFLESMVSGSVSPKKSRVAGSNLTNLQAVVEVAEKQEGFVYLDRKFTYHERDNTKRTLVIDIVADYGKKWIKVTARNVSFQ